jgi:hypothetical protein
MQKVTLIIPMISLVRPAALLDHRVTLIIGAVRGQRQHEEHDHEEDGAGHVLPL